MSLGMKTMRIIRSRAKKTIWSSISLRGPSGLDHGIRRIRSWARERMTHGKRMGMLNLRLETMKGPLPISAPKARRCAEWEKYQMVTRYERKTITATIPWNTENDSNPGINWSQCFS
jgi:hypothetical protein